MREVEILEARKKYPAGANATAENLANHLWLAPPEVQGHSPRPVILGL